MIKIYSLHGFCHAQCRSTPQGAYFDLTYTVKSWMYCSSLYIYIYYMALWIGQVYCVIRYELNGQMNLHFANLAHC